MSLTSMLDDRHGVLRDWFENRMPNLRPMQKRYREAGSPTLLAAPEVILGTVGTALDYRLRYYFAVTPPEDFVAANGGRRQPSSWAGAGEDGYSRLSLGLAACTAEIAPVGRRLSAEEEELLCRYCYVLALFEESYRAPGHTLNSPLGRLTPDCCANEMLSIVPSDAVADLCALSRAFFDTQADWLHRGRASAVLNPVLSGASLVGGADADLVVDHCLLEVKTTKQRGLSRNTAYQLIGYPLLDLHDDLAITSVGFYLSRIPALITWRLDDLLIEVGGPGTSVDALRVELQTLLSASPR